MVVWELPATTLGGVPGHVRGLGGALSALGHDVVVLTTGRTSPDDGDSPRILRANVDLPWLPDDDVIASMASANNHLTSLIGRLGDWKPDVVHAHDWTSSWCAHSLAEIFAVPLIATFHSTERGRHGGFVPIGSPSAIHAIESWLALSASDVICCSRFMTREVIDAFELLPPHVHLVPNGVDADLWRIDDTRPRGKSVLAWGRVQYEKGFQILAQAMSQVRALLPGVSCVIAGRGPYLPELQSQIDIESVADLVHLAGYVSDEELRELLVTAGCVVIPSLYEPFGIVALEALAAGAPTIAARTGGLAEIMEGTSAGLLFEPGNAHQLADRIVHMLTDEEVARRSRIEGRRLVESQYSWDAIAHTTVDVYRQALRPGVNVR